MGDSRQEAASLPTREDGADSVEEEDWESKWYVNYCRLQSNYEKYGDCKVSKSVDPTLAQWVYTQRCSRRSGQMTDTQIEMLNDLRFDWDAEEGNNKKQHDLHEEKWRGKLDELVAFHTKNGHFNVSYSANKTLYNWVAEQRNRYKEGELAQDREEQLESIDFEWERPPARSGTWDEKWERKLDDLVAFHTKNGHFNVPNNENHSLYCWVNRQRTLQESNELAPHRRDVLNAIDFDWRRNETTMHNKWKKRCDQLADFRQKHGHCRVLESHDKKLSHGVRTQRSQREFLDEERKGQLDRLGFDEMNQMNSTSRDTKKAPVTSPRGSQWEAKFAELQQFREAKGHCSVTEEENPSLAVWVERQRCVFRHNILAECRIEQLESIDFCFVPVAKRGNIDEDDDDSHESADKPQDKIEYHEKKRSSPMALKSVDRKKPRTSSSGRRKQGHEKPVDPTVPRPSVPASSHTRVSPSSPSRGKVIYGARRQIRFGTMVELENTIGPKQYEFSYEDGTTETLSAQEAQEALNLGESEKSKYIGKRIAKTFDGQPFMGTIVSYRDGGDVTYWKVDYDDGDSEEFDIKDVNKYMKFFDYIGLMH